MFGWTIHLTTKVVYTFAQGVKQTYLCKKKKSKTGAAAERWLKKYIKSGKKTRNHPSTRWAINVILRYALHNPCSDCTVSCEQNTIIQIPLQSGTMSCTLVTAIHFMGKQRPIMFEWLRNVTTTVLFALSTHLREIWIVSAQLEVFPSLIEAEVWCCFKDEKPILKHLCWNY